MPRTWLVCPLAADMGSWLESWRKAQLGHSRPSPCFISRPVQPDQPQAALDSANKRLLRFHHRSRRCIRSIRKTIAQPSQRRTHCRGAGGREHGNAGRQHAVTRNSNTARGEHRRGTLWRHSPTATKQFQPWGRPLSENYERSLPPTTIPPRRQQHQEQQQAPTQQARRWRTRGRQRSRQRRTWQRRTWTNGQHQRNSPAIGKPPRALATRRSTLPQRHTQ